MPNVPLEAIADNPLPGMRYPMKFAFAPDGRHLTFLDSDGGLSRQLMAMDLETGARRQVVQPPGGETEQDLPLEEKLRRERLRERGLGVTRYDWSAQGERVLVPLAGGIWIQDGLDGDLREVVPRGKHPALDPTFSPSGGQVAFVQDAELYVVDADGGAPRQLTEGARGTGRTHGLAEYIAQEEMDRMRGYWWSRDGAKIALVEVDETHIPTYRIMHQGSDAVGDGAQEDHAYPFAGAANARVRLGVVELAGGAPTWLELEIDGEREDLYLARVDWAPDGSLWIQLQDRRQSRLELQRFDPSTGARRVILVERSDVWLNLHDLLYFLEDGGFLWGSERDGWMRLYRYGADGACAGALTAPGWMVESLAGVDEARGRVYVTGTFDDPRQDHLYRVPLTPPARPDEAPPPTRLTTPGGTHVVALDRELTRFVENVHDLRTAPTILLRSLEDGALLRTIHAPDDPRIDAMELPAPELVEVTTRDGETLYGALYRPSGEGPFPTLISVYGGPHAQRVKDSWGLSVDLRAQHLAGRGFAVFKLDNRGSARRGLAFEGALRWDMGAIEVRDQVDGVRWLVERGIADPARVGIYGWSYGGYMSLMCLARAPETFQAACAGAPVTHWDGYDTHYTERYMGLPSENVEGYARSSVMANVDGMEGALLLVHGLLDENVHFRHTARLIDPLIRADVDHRLLMFPAERHMPRDKTGRTYMEGQIRAFFEAALG